MSDPMSVSGLLISRLKELGVDHLFGIPGDYVLPFFDELVRPGGPIEHVGTCNELTAVNLAEGYSRIRGFGAAAVTYGPGAFNAVNGVAGAYEENVPLILISGAPNTTEFGKGKLLHHVVGSDIDKSLRIFEQVTVAADRINRPEEAVSKIDRLITSSLDHQKPVYLEIPYDMQIADCPNTSALNYTPPASNPEKLAQVVGRIDELVGDANSVSMLPGVFVERNRLTDVMERLLASTGIPFATTYDAKAGYLEYLPNCIGFYQGAVSEEFVRETIEGADVLLTVGLPCTEFNTGMLTHQWDESKLIALGHDSVNIQGEQVSEIYLRDLLPRLAEVLPPGETEEYPDTFEFTRTKPLEITADAELTVDRMYQRLAHFYEEGDLVTGNTGGYVTLTRVRLPKGTITAGPGNWGSLGALFPTTIGMTFADPNRRVITLEGDGSFLMTGQELSTLVRYKHDFLLIILNNEGYTAERAIQPDKYGSYNDIQVWRHHLLPEAFGGDESLRGVEVRTEGEFDAALKAFTRGKGPYVINVHLGELDVAGFNSKMSEAMRH